MKVVNETHWRTDHLRRFLYAVGREELEPEDLRRLHVRVIYGRGRHYRYGSTGGYAWYNSTQMVLKMPQEIVISYTRRSLAMTIAHEMAHCRGMQHRDMRDSPRYSFVDGWWERYAWANDLPLEKKAPKKKKPRLTGEALAAERAEHFRGLLAQWETRAKRAATAIKKYRAKIRYYERRVAACAKREIDD